MKDWLSRLAHRWLERGKRKRYAGSLFDRFEGLEPLLAESPGASVLDIGACDGLVAYELARAGARLVHGFERDGGDVAFARRLFRDVPVEAAFVEADLSGGTSVMERHALLLDRYDIVLFLGVHHHLAGQMERTALDELVGFLADRADKLFAVRTVNLEEVEPLLLGRGFARVAEAEGIERVGPLRIYRRG